MTEREQFEAWEKQHPQEIEVQCPVCGHTFYEWPNDQQQHTEAITEWNRRAQPAQAGQVLSDEEMGEIINANWGVGVSQMARAIEQAVLAKRVPQVLTVEAIESACDDEDKNSEYSCGFYAGVRWHETHLRGIAGEKGGA